MKSVIWILLTICCILLMCLFIITIFPETHVWKDEIEYKADICEYYKPRFNYSESSLSYCFKEPYWSLGYCSKWGDC